MNIIENLDLVSEENNLPAWTICSILMLIDKILR